MPNVDLKRVRANLLAKKQQLERLLQEHRRHFDEVEKQRYEKAIAQVGAAHLSLMSLDCDPPNMSFEFPPLGAIERAVRIRDAANANRVRRARMAKKAKKVAKKRR